MPHLPFQRGMCDIIIKLTLRGRVNYFAVTLILINGSMNNTASTQEARRNKNPAFHPHVSIIIPITRVAPVVPNRYPKSPVNPVAEPAAFFGTMSRAFTPIRPTGP